MDYNTKLKSLAFARCEQEKNDTQTNCLYWQNPKVFPFFYAATYIGHNKMETKMTKAKASPKWVPCVKKNYSILFDYIYIVILKTRNECLGNSIKHILYVHPSYACTCILSVWLCVWPRLSMDHRIKTALNEQCSNNTFETMYWTKLNWTKRKRSACNGMNFIWIMHNERVADRAAAPAQIPKSE